MQETSPVGESPFDSGATPTPDLSLPMAQGHVIAFDVLPNGGASPTRSTLAPGDMVIANWDAEGASVELCMINHHGIPENCEQDLPLSGTRELTLKATDPVADHWVDIQITARGDLAHETVSARVFIRCRFAWFADGLSPWCPVAEAEATEGFNLQAFEHGPVTYQSGPDHLTATILYDDGTFWSYSANGVMQPTGNPVSAPAGLITPDESLLALWQGELEGLANFDGETAWGWATGVPVPYTRLYQCAFSPEGQYDGIGPCYESLPNGRIIEWASSPEGEMIRAETGGAAIFIWTGTYNWLAAP